MARKTTSKPKKKAPEKPEEKPKKRTLAEHIRRVRRWVLLTCLFLFLLVAGIVASFAVINPPTTPYMWSEARRLGQVEHEWVDLEEIAPVLMRSVVAAEDANFCLHFGFDMNEIRKALDSGGSRGASTLTQQTVKNLFLWQGRSWVRKAMEAVLTPMAETFWSKSRTLELYLNIAEFDEGVFGIEAASRNAFRVGPEALTSRQAAQLAAVLPNPKKRSASRPTSYLKKRARIIADGAATIKRDGRASCLVAK